MTRSFLIRSTLAAVLLGFGLASVWGSNSMYDRMISALSVAEIAIVLTTLIVFWIALILWVLLKLEPSKWARRQTSRGKTASVLLVIAAACIASPQLVTAWTIMPTNAVSVEVQQPFTLEPEHQKQVNEAVAVVSREAQDHVGFVVSIEMAIGIFIAAILVGTTLYIMIRMVCKSLDRMKETMRTRLGKLRDFLVDPRQTNNPPVLLGAALFRDRPATTNDLPIGSEFLVELTVPEPEVPAVLNGFVPAGETVTLDEFMAPFGLDNRWPLDSAVGAAVSRVGYSYQVAPTGTSNLVTLSLESCTNIAQNAYKSVLRLVVPVGAVIDFADLSGASNGRFWRVVTMP